MESPEEVIRRAGVALYTAELGLKDTRRADPMRRECGLMNTIVWGRSFTNVLQRLRSFPGLRFDDWYSRYRQEMENDELMKFFYDMRSEVLKRGELAPTTTGILISKLTIPDDLLQVAPRPDGASGVFIDGVGVGWIIGDPDGSEDKYYVKLPEDVVTPLTDFRNPPKTHLGQSVAGKNAAELAELYHSYLRNVYLDAKREFGRGI